MARRSEERLSETMAPLFNGQQRQASSSSYSTYYMHDQDSSMCHHQIQIAFSDKQLPLGVCCEGTSSISITEFKSFIRSKEFDHTILVPPCYWIELCIQRDQVSLSGLLPTELNSETYCCRSNVFGSFFTSPFSFSSQL